MTFRQLHSPCQKIMERDQKIKNHKCKCHHHKQVLCVEKHSKSFSEIEQFCDRLYNENERLKNRKKKETQRISRLKEEKEMEQCSFMPRTYENPQYFVSKSSFLERELNWSESKIRKLKQQKDKRSSLQTSGLDFKPKIIKNSDRIIEKMRTQKKVIETPAKRRVEVMTSNSYMDKYKKNQTGKKLFEGSGYVTERKYVKKDKEVEKKVCEETSQSVNEVEHNQLEVVEKHEEMKEKREEKQEQKSQDERM